MNKDFENRFHLTDYVNGYYISTVYLGIDYIFGLGKPLYYETIVFKNGDWSDLYLKRYFTKKKAIKGHKHAIDIVKHWRAL